MRFEQKLHRLKSNFSKKSILILKPRPEEFERKLLLESFDNELDHRELDKKAPRNYSSRENISRGKNLSIC